MLFSGRGRCPGKGWSCKRFIIQTIGGKLPNLGDARSSYQSHVTRITRWLCRKIKEGAGFRLSYLVGFLGSSIDASFILEFPRFIHGVLVSSHIYCFHLIYWLRSRFLLFWSEYIFKPVSNSLFTSVSHST